MQKIEKYNCDRVCCFETCDKKYTRFTKIKINGMMLYLCFCEEHAQKFEENKNNEIPKRL